MNGGMGQAFSEVINQYRVAEFQRRAKLPDAARLSLLGLALECGFNSKATFNRAFKKVVGLSPSEWIKA
jgi:AraC-like DNA-binding protein